MAKKIRQDQVDNLVESLLALSNKKVASTAFSGTTTKTFTITFTDGSTVSSNFTDLDTTYPGMTQALLNAGIDTVARTISADVLVEYINSRLSSIFRYAGTVTNYGDLPTTGQNIGDTWNIINGFSQNGQNYPPGSNVAWNGSDWDVLAGFIDTSLFLTSETDPKGVNAIEITGTGTKTITVTLRDGSTVSGNFTDIDTTYSQGTSQDLQTGTDGTGKVWSANTLANFLSTLQVSVKHENINITNGMISGNSVNITPTGSISDKHRLLVFLNGVKQPIASYSMASNILVINQPQLPTPVIVGDDIELYYL